MCVMKPNGNSLRGQRSARSASFRSFHSKFAVFIAEGFTSGAKKRPPYISPLSSQAGQYPCKAYAATGPDLPVSLIEVRMSCPLPHVGAWQAKYDFLGTVPPRLSVKNVT